MVCQVVSLYTSVPFCRTICTYCDFNVYAHLGKLFDAYVRAVTQEIENAARAIPAPRRASSLAFGGGTPSILPAPLLAKICDAIHAHFQLEPDAEITLEANPGSVDSEKLRALRELGVNRLSLGVQTFDDARLKTFNRRHSVAESYAAFESARRVGFDNINLDLLFGLPDQTIAEWALTLDLALALGSEHLSLYGLTVEEGTALARQIARGRVHAPDPDLAADMYWLAEEKVRAAGFEHYEISNWARPGYRSRHNLTYWRNQPYLGFGAGAHSYFRGERYANVRAPQEYIARLARGESVVETREVIAREREMAETLVVGLRLEEGIAFADFAARFDVDVRAVHGATLAQMCEWDLMELDDARMRLTPRGRLLSNQVLWRFL